MKLHTTETRRQVLRQHHTGATVVEMAVVLPLVFLLFFAAFELSQANALRHTVEAAAYEGARAAIVPGSTAATAQQAAGNLLTAVAVRGSSVSVEPATILPDTKQVTVKITIPFSQNSWVAPAFLKRTVLASSCTLNREVVE